MTDLTDLPYATCLRNLRQGVVGRAAVCTPSGPRILPVNYAVVDDAILFRTTPYSVLGSLTGSVALAFEVDSIDYQRHEGWSVVATGRASVLHDAGDIADARSLLTVQPWAGGPRHVYVRMRWDELTGRQVAPAKPLASHL